MNNKLHIARDGKELGVYALSEIQQGLKTGEFLVTDYVYDEKAKDWVLLLEHQAIKNFLKEGKPSAPPSTKTPTEEKTANPIASNEDWFVLKGDHKFGPFDYADVIRMLQDKSIYEFDFAWNAKMESWKRIAEIPEFAAEQIRNNKHLFAKRQHKRQNFNGRFLVHDNQQLWKGEGIEISEGGAGVLMNNSMLVPGQTLFLHFKPAEDQLAFNVVCEVVSKKFVDGVRDSNATVKYGLKFTNLSAQALKVLKELTHKRG